MFLEFTSDGFSGYSFSIQHAFCKLIVTYFAVGEISVDQMSLEAIMSCYEKHNDYLRRAILVSLQQYTWMNEPLADLLCDYINDDANEEFTEDAKDLLDHLPEGPPTDTPAEE